MNETIKSEQTVTPIKPDQARTGRPLGAGSSWAERGGLWKAVGRWFSTRSEDDQHALKIVGLSVVRRPMQGSDGVEVRAVWLPKWAINLMVTAVQAVVVLATGSALGYLGGLLKWFWHH